MTLTTSERKEAVRLLGLLEEHLASAVESATFSDGKAEKGHEQSVLQDRRDMVALAKLRKRLKDI